MILYIAEKPSVGRAIADALPVPQEEQHLQAHAPTSCTMHWGVETGENWWHCQANQQRQPELPAGWALHHDPSSDLPYAVDEATQCGHCFA